MLARKASCSVESTNSAKSGNSVLGNAQSCEFEADTSSMKQNSPGYVPPGVIVALEKRPTVHLLAENETIVTESIGPWDVRSIANRALQSQLSCDFFDEWE